MIEYVTPRQLAEEYGISINAIERKCKLGQIDAKQVGGRWLIPAAEVDKIKVFKTKTPKKYK